MEVKNSLKVGLENCGFGMRLELYGSGYKRHLKYLCWKGLCKGTLVYFRIIIAIII